MAIERRPRGRRGRQPPAPQVDRPAVRLDHAAPADARRFEDQGVEWLVWVAGRGLGGTGGHGLCRFDALHFAPADAPGWPVLETLICRGEFDGLYDDQLRALRASATPVPALTNGAGPG